MAPTTDPKVEKAVQYVVQAGMSARDAWEKAGSWMIVASRSGLLTSSSPLALEAPPREPLALMGPSQ